MRKFFTTFGKLKDKDDERSLNQALAAANKNINDLAEAVVNDMVGRFTVQYGLNWPAALAANLGFNWITVFQAALGANWAQALAANAQSGAANGIDAATLLGTTPSTIAGGLPAAPRPKVFATGALSEWYSISAGDGVNLNLPAGGTWAYVAQYKETATNYGFNDLVGGVAAGGTTIRAGVANYSSSAVVFRVT